MSASPMPLRLVDLGPHAAAVLLDRPAKRNALDVGMWRRLGELVDEAAQRQALRCLVLGSTTPGMFCAGADLGEFSAERATWDATLAYERVGKGAMEKLRRLPLVTIAAVDGDCFGGAVELATSCDLVVASSRSRFCIPPARIGLIYDPESTRFLTSRIAPSTLRWMLLTARPIDAAAALAAGLACQVWEEPDFEERLRKLVEDVAGLAPLALRGTKGLLSSLIEPGRPEQDWTDARRESIESHDHHEAVAAFNERRRPQFRGR